MDLFDLPETLSPRLAWMREHGITVKDCGRDFDSDDEDDFGNPLYRFCAFDRDGCPTGYGHTEDDALLYLAQQCNIRLWNER